MSLNNNLGLSSAKAKELQEQMETELDNIN